MMNSLGYDPELPAGCQDADIEMSELVARANAPKPRPRWTVKHGETCKAIEMKDGTTVPKGSPVCFLKDNPSRCLVQGSRADPYLVRVSSAFKPPSREELEEAASDCACETVLGNTVEPDGWDSEGSPSWLLALGMI